MAVYYMATPEMEEKLIAFLKRKKPTMYAKAHLAGEVLKDMGKPTDIVSSVLMMQSLQDLYNQREDYVEVA